MTFDYKIEVIKIQGQHDSACRFVITPYHYEPTPHERRVALRVAERAAQQAETWLFDDGRVYPDNPTLPRAGRRHWAYLS